MGGGGSGPRGTLKTGGSSGLYSPSGGRAPLAPAPPSGPLPTFLLRQPLSTFMRRKLHPKFLELLNMGSMNTLRDYVKEPNVQHSKQKLDSLFCHKLKYTLSNCAVKQLAYAKVGSPQEPALVLH